MCITIYSRFRSFRRTVQIPVRFANRLIWQSQVAETEGLLVPFRHLRFAPSNPRVLHPSILSLHLFHKWRRRRDSNPRNPFEVRFFSKEVLSATQSRLQKVNVNTKRACFKDQSKIAERVHFSLYDRISSVY